MNTQQLGQGYHTLAFTDSSSVLGRINKSSFDPVREKPHNTVAWWMGYFLVRNYVSLYSQLIKLTKHIIADSLSRDFHHSDKYPTTIFKSILPSQRSASLKTKPLTIYITSWILLPEESSTQPKESQKSLQKNIMTTWKDGALSSHTQASRINSCKDSNMELRQHWCHNSRHQCIETSLTQQRYPN